MFLRSTASLIFTTPADSFSTSIQSSSSEEPLYTTPINGSSPHATRPARPIHSLKMSPCHSLYLCPSVVCLHLARFIPQEPPPTSSPTNPGRLFSLVPCSTGNNPVFL